MKRIKLHSIFFAIVAIALIANGAPAIAATALQSGVPVALPAMPASSFVSNLYLDIDSSAAQLVVNVAGPGMTVCRTEVWLLVIGPLWAAASPS